MIDTYLEKIQAPDESIFPMDSVHTGKKVKKRVVYGEDSDPTNKEKKRIMIDFDGVIHNYSEWNDGKIDGGIIPGAKESIDQLKDHYEIVIFTTRASDRNNGPEQAKKSVKDVASFLESFSVHYDMITAEKLGAVAYVDDRAIRFTGSWFDTLKELQTIKT